MKINLLLIFIFSTLLVACSHTTKISDKMLAYSKEAETHSNQWNEGDKMILEGKSLKEKGTGLIRTGQKEIAVGNKEVALGNKDISNGHQLLIESENLIEHGMLMKKESELSFKDKFPHADIQ